jgi:hypothetical protein
MLVVVGSPCGRSAADGRTVAAGLAAEIARRAASGAPVQIVGRVGEDPVGDAVLIDLAAANVGHVAVLRTPGAATPLATAPSGDEPDDAAAGAALGDLQDDAARGTSGLPIDAGDLELAFRYLPDYRVIVVTPGLDPDAMETVIAAAGWSAARLVILDDGAAPPADLPADATVLAQPPDADSAFAAVVARYAVELDRGTEPGAAFAAASRAVGWEPVES